MFDVAFVRGMYLGHGGARDHVKSISLVNWFIQRFFSNFMNCVKK